MYLHNIKVEILDGHLNLGKHIMEKYYILFIYNVNYQLYYIYKENNIVNRNTQKIIKIINQVYVNQNNIQLVCIKINKIFQKL